MIINRRLKLNYHGSPVDPSPRGNCLAHLPLSADLQSVVKGRGGAMTMHTCDPASLLSDEDMTSKLQGSLNVFANSKDIRQLKRLIVNS